MAASPSIWMFIAVYLGWIASIISIGCTVLVRTSSKFSKWVANIPLSTWSFTTIVLAIGTYFLVFSQQLGGMVVTEEIPAGAHGLDVILINAVDAVIRTIRCFSAEDEVVLVDEVVRSYFPVGMSRLYLFTNSLQHLAAPVDTLMGIFILVTKVFSAPVLRLSARKHDTYVFSRLNERTMHMAKNIHAHYRTTSNPHETENSLIAFAKTADMESDTLYREAITHGMVCLDQPAYAVARFLSDSPARRTYVFADDDELENLHEGTRFVRDYVIHQKGRRPVRYKGVPEVYLLSSTPVSESFVDAATADAIVDWSDSRRPIVSVRRADWVRNTIETLLWRMPIFLTTRPTSEEDERQLDSLYRLDRRRVLIVGGGTIGYEFLKTALWCSQLGDVHFTFDIIDKAAGAIREHLAYDAPEILRLNGDAKGAEYDINFLGMDATSGSYLDHLVTHRGDITYVLVALGNDLTNVRVARRTREVLEQGRFGAGAPLRSEQPLIAAIVSDGALAESVEGMATGNGIPYDIVTVGSYERIFSFANMFRFELDRLGRNINRAYWGCYDGGMGEDDLAGLRAQADAEYERLEYNRRSSRASAVHLKYDLYAYVRRTLRMGEGPKVSALTWQMDFFDERDGQPTALVEVVDRYDQLVTSVADGEQAGDAPDLEWMSRIEHDRWDAYMRTEGYVSADQAAFEAFLPHTRENQSRLAKQHVCLVPFDELDEVSAFVYPGTHRDRDRDYKLADDKIVRHMGDIIRDYAE